MFEPAQVTFLESGCALIVGTVSPDGEPRAARGWGLTVLRDPTGDRVRVLVGAEDDVTVEHLRAGGRVAITACSVRTCSSQQLKGHALAVTEATDADRDRAAQYCDAFYADILENDGTPRSLTSRMTPPGYVVCTVAVDEVFDQTPGPEAGRRVTAAGI